MENDQEAFLAAFAGEPLPDKAAAQAEDQPRADESTEAKVEDQPAADQKQEEQQVEDPFANLPQAVKERLALIPRLEHEARSAQGRAVAFQRRLDEIEAASKPKPEPKKYERIEALRTEMPEVAGALQDVIERLDSLPAAEPKQVEQPADTRTPEQIEADRIRGLHEAHPLLTAEHANWIETVNSADWALWLQQQTPAYQRRLQDTDSEIDLATALTHFSKHQQAAAARVQTATQAATKVTQSRQARMQDAAVEKTSTARRESAGDPVYEAFMAGFKSG